MIEMRRSRTVGVITAALVAVGGYVHLCLYRHGYRYIPKIGVSFLLQVIASVAVAGLLIVGKVSERDWEQIRARLALAFDLAT